VAASISRWSPPEVVERGIVETIDRQPHAEVTERMADRVDLLGLGERDRCDSGSDVQHHVDEPLSFKLLDRLSNRDLGDAELPREPIDRKPLAGLVVEVQDALPQQLAHRLRFALVLKRPQRHADAPRIKRGIRVIPDRCRLNVVYGRRESSG
jgi:hypothetical protein